MGTTTLRGDDPFDDTSEADEHYELAPEDHPGGSSERPSVILNKGRINHETFSLCLHYNQCFILNLFSWFRDFNEI